MPARYSDDSLRLRSAALKKNWRTERLQIWRAPDHLKNEEIVLYGEPLFAAAIAEQLDIGLIEPTHDLLARIPEKYLIRKVLFTTLGEARLWKERAFIKPADEKCFAARVYENGQELPVRAGLSENTPTLISEPVDWELEARVFLRNREALCYSPYLRRGKLAQDEKGEWPMSAAEVRELKEFLTGFLEESDIELPPSVVLDAGKIKDRDWALVEFNPAFASGLYGCDACSALESIEVCSVPEARHGEELRPWILTREYE